VSDLTDQDLVATVSPFQAPGVQAKVPSHQQQQQQQQQQSKRRQKWGAALSRLRRSRSEQVQVVKGPGQQQQMLRPAATLGSGLLLVTAEGTDADSSASSSRDGCAIAGSKASSRLGPRKLSLGKRLKQLLL
jgi:hypothetical protein